MWDMLAKVTQSSKLRNFRFTPSTKFWRQTSNLNPSLARFIQCVPSSREFQSCAKKESEESPPDSCPERSATSKKQIVPHSPTGSLQDQWPEKKEKTRIERKAVRRIPNFGLTK